MNFHVIFLLLIYVKTDSANSYTVLHTEKRFCREKKVVWVQHQCHGST